jgi:RimJ/RimL family protein N-acetyltransferase
MRLVDISLEDLALYEALRCDPDMMTAFGGPQSATDMPDKLRRDVEAMERGEIWVFKIVVDESDDWATDSEEGRAAGSVCIWPSEHQGEPVDEIGWMVLPALQRKGIATQAVEMMLDRARIESRWGPIHAFPVVTNEPSNALCRKLGFGHLGECEIDWAGRALRCNHWVLMP